jgi:hypothetical protein
MSARPSSSASELTNGSLGSQACLQKKEKKEFKEAEIAADSRKSIFGKIIDSKKSLLICYQITFSLC